MFVKLLAATTLISISIAEGPPHAASQFSTSGKAVSSQTFIRKDVPLSYQYNSVHEYTTIQPKPDNKPYITSNLDNRSPVQFDFQNGYNRQYATQPSSKTLQATSNPLYTKVDANDDRSQPSFIDTNVGQKNPGSFKTGHNVQVFSQPALNRSPQEAHNIMYTPIYINDLEKQREPQNDPRQTLFFTKQLKAEQPTASQPQKIVYALIPKEYITGHKTGFNVNSAPLIAYAGPEPQSVYLDVGRMYGYTVPNHQQTISTKNNNPAVYNNGPTQSFRAYVKTQEAPQQEVSSSQQITHLYPYQYRQPNVSFRRP